jgi:two-component system cell cycle response regulator DivK
MKILIIEDSPPSMKLVSLLMTQGGHDVLEAGNADRGITLAREKQPDLILLDIQLPGMDGLTAARLLKNDPLTRHVPIIAMTAFAMSGDEERFLAAGCDGYIAKPLRYKKLLKTVDSFLKASGKKIPSS